MKHLFIILFFIPTFLHSQPIVIENGTHFPIEIKIIKEGTLIHHHTMNFKDQVTVEDVGWYGTKFMIKHLTDNCSDKMNGNYKPDFQDGWYFVFYTKKYLQDYHEFGGKIVVLLPICKCQIKA